MSETFRLAYVPGATPGKWARVWRERLPDVPLELVQVAAAEAQDALAAGRADAAIARLPVDTGAFSRIPLYEEIAVVCVPREHLLAALGEDESVAPEDLADETVWLPRDDVLYRPAADPAAGSGATAAVDAPGRRPVDPDGVPLDAPATAADALALVGAAAGVTVLPMSLARLHRRKDVVHRVLEGGPAAPVGLVWPAGSTSDLVEEMIGIVRGRTVNSSRGRGRPNAAAGEAGRTEREQRGKARQAASGRGRQGKAGARRGRPPSSKNGRKERKAGR